MTPLRPVPRTLGARRWQLDPAIPEAVAGCCAAGLERLGERAEVLHRRDKRQRSTTLARCNGSLMLAKAVKPLPLRVRVRSWFRGRPASREWAWACRFAELGVAIPRPWAFSDGGAGGTSWFVQEGLPDVQDALQMYTARLQGADRDAELWRQFTDQLGAMLAAIHDAGIDHPDLHAGNLLCTGATADDLKVWLVDYHSVRHGRGDAARYELANLTKLAGGLLSTFSRDDLRDVLAAYLTHRTTGAWTSAEDLLARIQVRVPAFLRSRARSRARRVLVDSGGFGVHRAAGTRIWYRRAPGLGAVQRLIDDANGGRLETHKQRPGSTVSRGALPDGTAVWVKTYTHAGLWKQIEGLVGRSYGRRGWHAAERLYYLGIRAPIGIAYVEERDGPVLRRSHLITRHVNHHTDLDMLLFTGSRLDGRPVRLKRKRALIAELARSVRRLHDLGVYHRDLSAKNILVSNAGMRWHLSFVDIESVRFPVLGLRRKHWAMNLAQLTGLPSTITLRDRLRFAHAYCAGHEPVRKLLRHWPYIAALGAKTQAAWRLREDQAREAGVPGPQVTAPPFLEWVTRLKT